jgi:hypothetical protein
MLFPAIVFLWLIGWSLFWIGSQHSQEKPHKTQIAAEKEKIEITSAIYDETELTHT